MIQIEIPNYITKVLISNKRRERYYYKGEKIPKKYLLTTKFIKIKNKETLIYIDNFKKVVKNSKTAGTAKYDTINGQKIMSGNIHSFNKDKWLKAISQNIMDNIPILLLEKQKTYPCSLGLHFYDDWSIYEQKDLDNHAIPYRKSITDTLVKLGILESDSWEYINSIPTTFTNSLEKKIIIEIK